MSTAFLTSNFGFSAAFITPGVCNVAMSVLTYYLICDSPSEMVLEEFTQRTNNYEIGLNHFFLNNFLTFKNDWFLISPYNITFESNVKLIILQEMISNLRSS